MTRVQLEEHPGVVVVSCAVPARMVWVVEQVLVVEVYPVPTLEEREHLKWAGGVVLELNVVANVGQPTSVAEVSPRRRRHRHCQLTDRSHCQLPVPVLVSVPVLE